MSENNHPVSAETHDEHEAHAKHAAVDGAVVIDVSDDKLTAYLHITEEKFDGNPVTYKDITSTVESHGINYKPDLDKAKELIEHKSFNKKIYLSRGFSAVNGEDGTIEYFFETSSTLVPKKGEHGNVDFKDLGLVRNITEGELIAKITMPTEGTPGMDVYGQEIPPAPGKEPKFIVGQGTELFNHGTEIKAVRDGNLVWGKGGFTVEETLVIKESVDVSTGNIDFIGNVLIKGNVAENFMVKSKKNVSVNGSVTNATIIADGDINIGLGSVNSNIVAQGNVKLGFCESSKVECQGDFYSKSVIAGEVYCGGSFNATQDRGVVFGGKHTALAGFNANIIGTESYTKTQVTLGNSAVLTEERLELSNKIKDLDERTRKLLQVAEVLQEHKKNFGSLSADREAMLTTAIRSRFTFQREVKQLNERIKEIDKELEFVGEQFVVVHKNLWPGVTVRIGTELLIVDRNMQKVMIGKDSAGHLAYLPISSAKSKS
ncbi:MAG: FapA family protein [Oscillospiraceae bacterium]|nr:FapA family protein [Oscillospiraceae bacterium]